MISNKIPFSKQEFKYFIGYKDAEKIKQECPRMSMYKTDFW